MQNLRCQTNICLCVCVCVSHCADVALVVLHSLDLWCV